MSNQGISVSKIMCSKCDVEVNGATVSELKCPKCGYKVTDEDIQILLRDGFEKFNKEREQDAKVD